MELAQAKPFRAFDDHDRSIRHIHSNFDDGCGDKDVGPACGEGVHVEFLVLVALLPVHDGCLVRWERKGMDYLFIALFQILVVHLLAFEYQRIDHEDLPPQGNLVPHELEQGKSLPFGGVYGLYRFPAGRKLVDDGDIKVAVEGHGESPRNRGRSHHKDVRRDPA